MNRLRTGAALIIVLLILLALMLLGLPFLYSQVWGLAGARSVQAAQAARLYLLGTEHLGAALGTYANTSMWTLTTGTNTQAQNYSALELYLGPGNPSGPMPAPLANPQGATVVQPPATAATSPLNLAQINPAAFGWNHGPNVVVGLQLSDESGRLDPNLLDAAGWWDLFKQVGIPDWDDNAVVPAWQDPRDGNDNDNLPELCQELEWYRVHHGRYARIEELRIPTPQRSGRRWGANPSLRKRLNAAEIERLRPFLSFQNRSPGRVGLTDLGSVVASDQDFKTDLTNPITDPRFIPSFVVMDVPASCLNSGTWVMAEPTPGGIPQEGLVSMGVQHNPDAYTYNIYYRSNTLPATNSGIWLQVPPVLNVHQLRAELAALPAYAKAFRPGATEQTLTAVFNNQPIRFYGQADKANALTPALPWDYLHPHFGTDALVDGVLANPPRERQPLDIRSDGLIRLTATSTVLDPAGAIVAQHQRTSIVQAVPQNQALERRWQTQGQFEPLVAQRFASGMSTWPKATARATDQLPDDVDPTAGGTPATDTGVSFTVNPSPASFKGGTNGALPHLTVAWRAPMGTDVPTLQAQVLKDRRAQFSNGALGTEPPTPASDPVTVLHPVVIPQDTNGEGLFPDGVRLGSNTQLAYSFDNTGGPLRMANPADPSLGYCHIGFWFRPETDWSVGTDPVTLMEARQGGQRPGQFVIAPDLQPQDQTTIPHDVVDQNYFAVLYDPKQNMLVACYTPPSATLISNPANATGPLGWTAMADDPSTPAMDERCLPDPNHTTNFLIPRRFNPAISTTWSKTYQPNRIMTCWKLGRRLDATGTPVANNLERGRWYYLQVVIGDGRPGGIGLMLDGLVGTDVGLLKKTDYLASRQASALKGPWPGDHLTIPSMLLLDDLPPVPKGSTGQTALLYQDSIGIELPGFTSFATDDYSGTPTEVVTPPDIIPNRGTVLIGDEYIRYEAIQQVTNPGPHPGPQYWALRTCARGARQDTRTGGLLTDLSTLPSTEAHPKGSRVLADGARLTINGTLLTGGTTLTQAFGWGLGDPTTTTGNYTITGTIQTPAPDDTNPIDATLPITVAGAGWINVPSDGIVRITANGSNSYYVYHAQNAGASVLLQPVTTSAMVGGLVIASNSVPYISRSNAVARITVVSMQVADLPTVGDFATPGGNCMLQLLGPDGKCEWLAYTDMGSVTTGTGTQNYFINANGWPWSPGGGDRARQRTPFEPVVSQTATPFPVRTQVLPVQVDGNVTREQSKVLAPGDLVTLVPTALSGSAQPVTLAVRYCANDGYADTPVPGMDTINGYLAFTCPLKGIPALSPNQANYEWVMGTGLNTLRDLTPLGNLQFFKSSATPRLDAHVDAAGNPGRLVLGGMDAGRLGTGETLTTQVMTIDAPIAGQWSNSAGRLLRVYGTGTPGMIADHDDLPCFIEASVPAFDTLSVGTDRIALVEVGGEVLACALLTDADLSNQALLAGMTTAQAANAHIYNGTAPSAYLSSNRGSFAKVIGRALLGSAASAHVFTNAVSPTGMQTPGDDQMLPVQQSAFGNFDLGPEFFRLPLGPVRVITEPDLMAQGTWFRMQDVVKSGTGVQQQDTTSLLAPAVLITEPTRATTVPPWEGQIEILQLGGRDPRPTITAWDSPSQTNVVLLSPNPHQNKFITASWMRGLYNTPVLSTWAMRNGGNGNVYPLAIGWWPRFASALPSATSVTPSSGVALPITQITPQHLRSRIYPWINFPLSLHLARFDDSAPFQLNIDGTKVMNSFLDQPDGVEVQVRAMAGTIGGQTNAAYAFGGANGTSGDWMQITKQVPGVSAWTGWHDIPGLYPWNSGSTTSQDQETDGIEVRVGFQYKSPISTSLTDAARSGNRAPLISGAKLRCYAPITTIAVEDAR